MNLQGSTFTVRVIANAPKTEIRSHSNDGKTVTVGVKAPPANDKANIELIKFLSRKIGKQVRIVRGKTQKTKIIRILE